MYVKQPLPAPLPQPQAATSPLCADLPVWVFPTNGLKQCVPFGTWLLSLSLMLLRRILLLSSLIFIPWLFPPTRMLVSGGISVHLVAHQLDPCLAHSSR